MDTSHSSGSIPHEYIKYLTLKSLYSQHLAWTLTDFSKFFPLPSLKLVFFWYKEEAFAHPQSIPAVVLIMMLYGWAIIPLVYTVSFSFKTPGSGCVKLVAMLTFLSISPVVLVTVTSEKGRRSHPRFA